MYQNLVVSPLFLKSFSSLELEKAQSIMASLATETFLCDSTKKLLEEYDKVKELNKDDPQSLLFIENFIKILTLGKAKLLNNLKAQDRKPNDLKNYDIEKKLALLDEWKIILTNISDKEISEKLEKELNIEISDTTNYTSPTEKSRIRAIQRITKFPGDEFHFRNWIAKFLKDTKFLIIHDGYACAKNESRDIEAIIKTLPRNAKVNIITLSDGARNNSRSFESDDGIIAEEILKELKNKNPSKHIKWELKDDKKLIEDRHLQTDRFFIDMGHALGSTYKDSETGKIICWRQFTIVVSKATQS